MQIIDLLLCLLVFINRVNGLPDIIRIGMELEIINFLPIHSLEMSSINV